MVCFEITIAYPLQSRYESNLVHQEAIFHKLKYHNADLIDSKNINNIVQIRLVVCDEDAVGFLRDIPQPTYVLQVKDKYKGTLLYSFWKVTNIEVKPPRYDLLLKKVYWSASQLERRHACQMV